MPQNTKATGQTPSGKGALKIRGNPMDEQTEMVCDDILLMTVLMIVIVSSYTGLQAICA